MKKWVVTVKNNVGRKETRLIPARNRHTALSNSVHPGDTVISCEAYTGQKLQISSQEDERERFTGYKFGRLVASAEHEKKRKRVKV